MQKLTIEEFAKLMTEHIRKEYDISPNASLTSHFMGFCEDFRQMKEAELTITVENKDMTHYMILNKESNRDLEQSIAGFFLAKSKEDIIKYIKANKESYEYIIFIDDPESYEIAELGVKPRIIAEVNT